MLKEVGPGSLFECVLFVSHTSAEALPNAIIWCGFFPLTVAHFPEITPATISHRNP